MLGPCGRSLTVQDMEELVVAPLRMLVQGLYSYTNMNAGSGVAQHQQEATRMLAFVR